MIIITMSNLCVLQSLGYHKLTLHNKSLTQPPTTKRKRRNDIASLPFPSLSIRRVIERARYVGRCVAKSYLVRRMRVSTCKLTIQKTNGNYVRKLPQTDLNFFVSFCHFVKLAMSQLKSLHNDSFCSLKEKSRVHVPLMKEVL